MNWLQKIAKHIKYKNIPFYFQMVLENHINELQWETVEILCDNVSWIIGKNHSLNKYTISIKLPSKEDYEISESNEPTAYIKCGCAIYFSDDKDTFLLESDSISLSSVLSEQWEQFTNLAAAAEYAVDIVRKHINNDYNNGGDTDTDAPWTDDPKWNIEDDDEDDRIDTRDIGKR